MTDTSKIENKSDLVAYLERGCKPKERWRIGSEHEKFVYRWHDLAPAGFGGTQGIEAHLKALSRFGWHPKYEDGNLIALRTGGASITLEPGGQLELSGAPLDNLHQTCAEVNDHLIQVKAVGEELDTGFLGIGFHPTARREDIGWMPKERYRIMRDYMPTRGSLGLDMMLRTCTVQVNLDFSDEADMVRKFRVGLALQPIATALFANSPFTEGKPNGFRSYRSHIWTDTDPDRTGMLPFVFDDGFGFERWVEYVLDVPMYFIERGGRMHNVAGASFRDLIAGRLEAFPGERATLKDWEDHLTTPFPEVRLKTFLEMRGADGGPWSRLCALPALWVGLLYDQEALDAAWDLCRTWTIEEQESLRQMVPRGGLRAEIRGRELREIALEVIGIADLGLRKRARLNSSGDSEQIFLKDLWDIAESGQTPADMLLRRFHTDWQGDVTPIFREYCY